jgi:Zn-dependent protease with chaperone function
MRLLISSVLLGLAWFAILNIVLSVMTWMIARGASSRGTSSSAGMLATLRLLPSAVSALLVMTVFLPVHWRFEPTQADEAFGVLLGSLAALSVALLMRSGYRTARVLALARQLCSSIRRSAILNGVRTFEVDGLPGVSLSGVIRPRILLGPHIRAALTPPELEAAVSHELAHQRSRDNLTRLAMYCAPDLLAWSGAIRRLEARWRAEIEYLADARAADGNDARALALASALVKVARMEERHGRDWRSPVLSTFNEPGLLEARVRRLVAGPANVARSSARFWCSVGILAAGVPASVWLFDLSHALHDVSETLVAFLP